MTEREFEKKVREYRKSLTDIFKYSNDHQYYQNALKLIEKTCSIEKEAITSSLGKILSGKKSSRVLLSRAVDFVTFSGLTGLDREIFDLYQKPAGLKNPVKQSLEWNFFCNQTRWEQYDFLKT